MTKTLKVALAGAGAFGLKHLDGIKLIDGVEVISLVGRELDKTKEAAAKYGVGPCHDRSRRQPQTARSSTPSSWRRRPRCTPPSRAAVPRGRQARAGGNPARRQPQGRRGGGRGRRNARGWLRMCGHTRRFNPSHQFVHKQHRGGRVQHPADGCANLFLPPHQHERARPAALLDRPSAPGTTPRIRSSIFAYHAARRS